MCVAGFYTCKDYDVCVCLLFAFQYMTAAAAAAPMQGTYIPQYTPVPPTAVPVEVRPTHMHTLLPNKKVCRCLIKRKTSLLLTAHSITPTSAHYAISKPAHHINRSKHSLNRLITFKTRCKLLFFSLNKWPRTTSK